MVLPEQFHTLSRRKQHTSLKSFARSAAKELQALCLRNTPPTLSLSTAMLSFHEPIYPGNAAAGQMVADQVDASTDCGLEALLT